MCSYEQVFRIIILCKNEIEHIEFVNTKLVNAHNIGLAMTQSVQAPFYVHSVSTQILGNEHCSQCGTT